MTSELQQRIAQRPWAYTDNDIENTMTAFAEESEWLIFGPYQYTIVIRLFTEATNRQLKIPPVFKKNVISISQSNSSYGGRG